MRNFLLLVSLCLFSAIANAKTYYVSPTGSDANAGTITAPFKTWDKLSSVMIAGDIAYIRGGTYLSTKGAAGSTHSFIQNLTGTATNPIKIWAYPGETPIFNLTNIGIPTNTDPTAFALINLKYVHLKGIRITGLQQNRGGNGISRGFEMYNCTNCTIDQIEVDHIGGSGFKLYDGCFDNLLLNCDAHNNDDRYSTGSDPWGGADGFSSTGNVNATRNTYDGCRSYLNSDDGWDFFNTDGISTIKNCWAFWNGYYKDAGMTAMGLAGNGEGFKLGPTHTDQTATTLRFVRNCLSFQNRDNGFDQNGTPTTLYQLYNNTSFKNGGDGFQFQYWPTGTTNPLAHTFKNNLAYSNTGTTLKFTGPATNNIKNSWNAGVTVSNADFQSVDTTGVTAARQADGSLPMLNFMKLIASSDLVNAGINVGLTFVATAPDLGAFEFGTIIVPVTLIDFSAIEKTGTTLLQWTTATEINSSHFEVERSTDGQNFEKIATVASNGNTNVRIDYKTIDNFPVSGTNFYRLKIVDRDGTYQYSKIVSIHIKSAHAGSAEIKSAIVSNKTLQLNISSAKQQPAVLSLYDDIGRVLFVSNITLQKGTNTLKKVITPANGIYFLKLKTNEEMVTLPIMNGE